MPHSTYLPQRMGSADIDPRGSFEAGSFQSFTLTYTAGYFGIDDTGSIKIVHRFASDMGKPQFDDPAAPNYVTAEASNGAVLDVRYDGKMNIRPWDKRLAPINHHNLDKRFEQAAPGAVEWTALTTGGFGGFDAWLADARAGTLTIDTALVKAKIPVADVGREDVVHDAGGIGRRIRVFRLPDENPCTAVKMERRVALRKGADNALYVMIVQEDGHQIWSSPIYVFDGDGT